MMDTEQPSAVPAEASADYQKTIRVKAHPDALFDALTSVSGLVSPGGPASRDPATPAVNSSSSLTPLNRA